MLHQKTQYSKIAAYALSFFALTTGSAAEVYGTATSAGVATGALAASGVFIAEGAGLLKLKARVRAYTDGLGLLEQSEARYYTAIANNPELKGRVSKTELTVDGARLYSQVVASLKLIEKALAAQIPTVEEVEAAYGESSD